MTPHHHAAPDHGRAFAVAIALNVALVVVQAAFAARAGSLALLADAGHNLGDVLGLVLGWGAVRLAKRQPTERHTYGLGASSILAALGNALLLLVAVGGVSWEAIQRLSNPEPVAGLTVVIVAAIAAVVNIVSALPFLRGSHHDLNLRAALMHLAADAAVSVGVVAVGAVLCFRDWWWLDPLVSLLIAGVIVIGAWRLLREALQLALAAVPRGIDRRAVEEYLASVSGVKEVHDLHIWAMSTTDAALTAHLVMPNGGASDEVIEGITHALHDRFRIGHATIQVETGGLTDCCPIAAPRS